MADDNASYRLLLRKIFERDASIEVVGEARNGADAVRLTRELKPDLLTLDLSMPIMNGIDAIREIMAIHALPILVISNSADANEAYQAVTNGALEAIVKPVWDPQQIAAFIAKVKLLAQVKVITHLRQRSDSAAPEAAQPARLSSTPPPAPARFSSAPASATLPVFAIASSTGGPQALLNLLQGLPSDFPCPILIAQHISDGFAQGMAEWLSSASKLPVQLAREGDAILPGHVYISPSESNLAVTSAHRLTLLRRLPGQLYHPCCDVLLGSVARVYGKRGVGMIFTGMGHDGVVGIADIRQAGGITLGQNEASSVIFGMNKLAINSGNVQRVLPLEQFATVMCSIASGKEVA